jgi:hypothetical protein
VSRLDAGKVQIPTPGGQSITFSEVCFENRDYALAIKREFRSWARALEAAFLETDAPG